MRELYERLKPYLPELKGSVIDIGARDYNSSNVRPFIEDGYDALLVEPNPKQVAQIKRELEERERQIVFGITEGYFDSVNTKPPDNKVVVAPVAITGENKKVDFIQSPNIGHSRIPNENFDKVKWQTKGQKKIKVDGWTFQKLIDTYPEFKNVDVLDIDTEGYDEIVLLSLFNTDIRPKFIMAEHWNNSLLYTSQWHLFTQCHYTEIGIELNQCSLWQLIL